MRIPSSLAASRLVESVGTVAVVGLLAAVAAAGCSSVGISAASTTGTTTPTTRSPAASPTPPAVIPLPTTLPAQISYDQAMRLFEYDRSRPFGVVERSSDEQDGATVHDLTYTTAAGSRAQAYLVVPGGSGPFGGAMYLHGAGGSSSSFLTEAIALTRHGVVSLLITQPEWKSAPASDAEAVNEIVFEMRELQRSLDLLAAQPIVDPGRLGFVGFSFGAVRGGTYAGVDARRLRITILASTPSSYDAPAMAPFDPIVWAPHVAPAALYLQEGTQDPWFTRAEAESYIAAAGQPKELVWYEANHGLNALALTDRLEWLGGMIGSDCRPALCSATIQP